jgi:hypothetical protein
MAALLVKASEVTKNTPIGGNVDVDKYIYCLKDAQITVIEPLLGTKLYKKLTSEFGTLTGDYLTLVNEYIKPILIHSAAAEYIVIAAYNISNSGISKHLPQDSESVSKAEVDYLAEKQRSKAQVYIERADRFLCDKNFPEYRTQDKNYDIKRQDINYMGGWKL